jgi:uracil-DNA glycosylase family 4
MTWDTFECPVCDNDEMVDPSGPAKAKILIIGEFPGKDEIIAGKPLVGPTGRIMRKELAYLDADMRQMRITNLWQHRPNKNEKCFEHGCAEAIKEAKDREAILLVGSDTVKYLHPLSMQQ